MRKINPEISRVIKDEKINKQSPSNSSNNSNRSGASAGSIMLTTLDTTYVLE